MLYDYDLGYDNFYEGTNFDVHNRYSNFLKTFKVFQMQYKDAMARADFRTARKVTDDITKELQNAINYIKSLDSTTGSTIIGLFLPTLKNLCITLLLTFGTVGSSKMFLSGLGKNFALSMLPAARYNFLSIISPSDVLVPPILIGVGGIGLFVFSVLNTLKLIYDLITQIDVIIKLSSKDGGINFSHFNLYRNRIIIQLQEIQKRIKKQRKQIDLVEMAYNKRQELIAHESVNGYDDMKLSIYENYDNGLISESEKNYLLSHLDDVVEERDNSTFDMLLNNIY